MISDKPRSYFKQYRYENKSFHSLIIKLHLQVQQHFLTNKAHYQTLPTWEKLERDVQTINPRFFSELSSLKFKLPNKLYAQVFTAILQYINIIPNSVHPTLTPSIIIKGHKPDVSTQSPVPFGTLAFLYYTKRVSNIYEPCKRKLCSTLSRG